MKRSLTLLAALLLESLPLWDETVLLLKATELPVLSNVRDSIQIDQLRIEP